MKQFLRFNLWIDIGLCVLVVSLMSCDGIFPAQSKPDVPPDHTRNISGFFHRPEASDPLDLRHGCLASDCHGVDLRGGVAVSLSGRRIVVPSCYECHGAVWEEEGDYERGDDDD